MLVNGITTNYRRYPYPTHFVICRSRFFLQFLLDTHVLFWGHWCHCFGFLVTSPLGFKVRVGAALFAFCRGECNVHPLRSTSDATLADLLAASTQPITFPHACAEVGLGSDLNVQLPGQKMNALPKFLNVTDRKIVDNWCKTMLFNGITHSNNNVVNRKTIGLEWLE